MVKAKEAGAYIIVPTLLCLRRLWNKSYPHRAYASSLDRLGLPETIPCTRHLLDDREAPSLHDYQPVADETAVLQDILPLARLSHDYLGLYCKRPWAANYHGRTFGEWGIRL